MVGDPARRQAQGMILGQAGGGSFAETWLLTKRAVLGCKHGQNRLFGCLNHFVAN